MLDRLPFKRIVAIDFEFEFGGHDSTAAASRSGERPRPVCMVAKDLRSGETWRLWRDQFGAHSPFPVDRGTLVVAYYASAELGCFKALNWPQPVFTLDLFTEFRARFIGKCSPVHYFWGAPDLAVTRFSGRRAPEHPGGVPNLPDRVTREAYSHEVSSCGFWPGGGPVPTAAFYSYAYPEPKGFSAAKIAPSAAFYSRDLGEFILPYDVVRQAANPDDALLAFLQTTYEAAANLAGWDRAALERSP